MGGASMTWRSYFDAFVNFDAFESTLYDAVSNHEPGELPAVKRRIPEHRLRGLGAPVIQMQVVLPGEAHPPRTAPSSRAIRSFAGRLICLAAGRWAAAPKVSSASNAATKTAARTPGVLSTWMPPSGSWCASTARGSGHSAPLATPGRAAQRVERPERRIGNSTSAPERGSGASVVRPSNRSRRPSARRRSSRWRWPRTSSRSMSPRLASSPSTPGARRS
jgi:hypothetical protein